MTRRTTVALVAALSVLAVAARLFVVVHFKAWRDPQAMEHRSIAQALVAGRGFTFGDWNYYGPTSVQSPPMPFLLAGLFETFGADAPADRSLHGANRAYFAVMLINCLAGGLTAAATYPMVRRMGGSAAAGVIAAGLVAVWPEQVYSARFVQVVSLSTLAVVAMVWLFYRAVQTRGAGAWVAFAAVAAVATLAEPVFLPALLLTAPLVVFWRGLPWSLGLRNAAVLAVAAAVVIGPWTVRNYVVHGHLIPVKGSFWVNVWKGSNDAASGSDRLALTSAQRATAWHQNGRGDDVSDTPHQYDMLDLSKRNRLANHPEAEREAMFRQWAVAWIWTHPGRFAQLCGIRLLKTLTIDWDHPRSYAWSYIGARAAVLLLGIGGVVVAARQRWHLAYPALLVATAFGSYTVTLTAARFAIPFEPLELAVGGALIAALFARRPVAGVAAGFPVTVPSVTVRRTALAAAL